MHDHIYPMSVCHQIRHQITKGISNQHGDRRWTPKSPSAACVDIYWFTYSFYHHWQWDIVRCITFLFRESFGCSTAYQKTNIVDTL